MPNSEKDNERLVVTPTLIPPLKITKAPFSSSVTVPPQGVVGEPIAFEIIITNHTTKLEDFSLLVKVFFFFVNCIVQLLINYYPF